MTRCSSCWSGRDERLAYGKLLVALGALRRSSLLTMGLAGLVGALGAGCSSRKNEAFNKPAAPDMSALVTVYDTPTGSVDEGNASAVLQAAQAVVDKIAALNIADPLLDAVSDALADVDDSDDADDSGNGLTQADGYLLVTRICGGWGAEPVPDPANGALRLTVGFTESGLDPVIWGEMESCQYLVGSSQVALRGSDDAPIGSVRFHLGGTLPFDRLTSARLLFDFDLGAELDGVGLDADFDYRVDPATAALEVRVPVSDGDVIALVSATGVAGVRARNGDFLCDQAAATCEQD